MQAKTRMVTNVGLFIAMSIVLTRTLSVMVPIGGVLGLRLSFGEIPLMLAGLFFGPVAGGLAGVVADLVGFSIAPSGPYFPGFTLSAALVGILPALVMGKWETGSLSVKRLFMAVFVTNFVTSIVLNTFWLMIMYQLSPAILLPGRLASQLVMIPAYMFIIMTLSRGYQVAQRAGYVH